MQLLLLCSHLRFHKKATIFLEYISGISYFANATDCLINLLLLKWFDDFSRWTLQLNSRRQLKIEFRSSAY